jgi:CRISPR-associated protein Cmr6
MNQDKVPMMFRAQINSRCQLHRVDKNKQRQDADKWVDEWKQIFPQEALPVEETPQINQPVSRQQEWNNRNSRNNRSLAHPVQNNLALARPTKANSTASLQSTKLKMPQFGSKVKTWEYTISWRLVSNSGQDEGVIRPIISAKGFPYYSGASMKGAFLRACQQICTTEEQKLYLGEKLPDGSIKPGILRFHGAYPVNMDWTKRLVDIIHSQDKKQVIADEITNANAQISLYQPKLKFGISSKQELSPAQWSRVEQILKIALSEGIGSRVSAGYGHFQEFNHHNQLLQIKLKGQGATSQLVNRSKEFRPNMFKAALRGHTLRLLGGMTDEKTAKDITQKLWGGFAKNSIVGLLGIDFDFNPQTIRFEKNQQFYQIQDSQLNIICMHRQIDDKNRKQLLETAEALIKFTIMFGGFGKSWRRICHQKFFKSYFDNPEKQVIGCHWEFVDNSLYYPVNDLKDIAKFINHTRQVIRGWIDQNKRVNDGVETWREAWYQPKVQIWGRLAENGQSEAIKWFHGAYKGTDSIKNPDTLAGSMENTGRIWHRMYPRFVSNGNTYIQPGKGYVELLTIFPDESDNTKKFLRYLKDESGFEQIW